MKKLLCTMALLGIFGVSEAQIKVADDSYTTQISTISELNRDVNFDAYYRHYSPSTTYLPIGTNPVGEKMYIHRNTIKKHICVNPANRTASLKSLIPGYYEFTGIIFVLEALDKCREEILKYKISENDRIKIEAKLSYIDYLSELDNLDGSEKALEYERGEFEKFRHTWETDLYNDSIKLASLPKKERKVAMESYNKRKAQYEERYKEELKNLHRYQMNYNNALSAIWSRIHDDRDFIQREKKKASAAELKKELLKISNDWQPNRKILPIYIVCDEKGNEYYIRASELIAGDYVMVSFYEKVDEMKGNKCLLYCNEPFVETRFIRDAISDEPIRPLLISPKDTESRTKVVDMAIEKPVTNYLVCEDVVLRNGEILAILKTDKGGSFAVKISSLDNYRYFYRQRIRLEMPIFKTATKLCDSRFNSESGDKIFVITKESLDDIHAQYRKLEADLAQAAKEMQRKLEYEEAQQRRLYIKNYGEKYGNMVADRHVVIGMTKDMCIDALGLPVNIWRTTVGRNVSETWLYGASMILTFDNNKLVMISEAW